MEYKIAPSSWEEGGLSELSYCEREVELDKKKV